MIGVSSGGFSMNTARVIPYRPHRSWKQETLNMAQAVGYGVALGSLIGGKKGATIGGVSGGFARWLRWWTTR
jgi:hypothetical protein